MGSVRALLGGTQKPGPQEVAVWITMITAITNIYQVLAMFQALCYIFYNSFFYDWMCLYLHIYNNLNVYLFFIVT